MSTKTTLDQPPIVCAAAAALATFIAIGSLTLVAELFQSRGIPMGEFAAADRGCLARTYVSERESCAREWIAVAHGDNVAHR